jgi:hypothetical protein
MREEYQARLEAREAQMARAAENQARPKDVEAVRSQAVKNWLRYRENMSKDSDQEKSSREQEVSRGQHASRGRDDDFSL